MNRLLNIAIYFLSLFIVFSCDKDDEAEVTRGVEEEEILPFFDRTVLVYMVAENSLATPNGSNAYLGFHGADSLEIAAAMGGIADNHCMLVYIDDVHSPRIYRFSRHKGVQLVRQWQEDVSSVNPETLREVLTWSFTKYKAKEYGLVMWSHSSGWIPASNISKVKSFGIDNGNNSYSDFAAGQLAPQMNVRDMAAAIEKSAHLRFILFDTCLMGDIETAFALRHATDYVIASPISIHAAGGYYTGLVQNGFFCEDITQIARTYFSDVTSEALSNVYGDYGMVIAAIKTDALEPLAATLREILPWSVLKDKQSPVLSYLTNYSEYSSSAFYRPRGVDALEVMNLLLPPDGEAVAAAEESAEPGEVQPPVEEAPLTNEDYRRLWREALEAAVPYHAATESFAINDWGKRGYVNIDDCINVSMFIPQSIYTSNAERCLYGDLNEAFRQTEWYDAAGWAQTGW